MTAAEWYKSVSIFPLKGKRPIISSWKPYELAKPTEEQLKAWKAEHKGCNWGMACGPASGVVVLDFDGVDGEALLLQYGLDEDTPDGPPRVKTTNGVHLYYAWPGNDFGLKIPNKVKIADGLDIRTKGGYVVIPPSVHPDSGVKYEFAVAPWDRPLPPLPLWFEDLVAGYIKSKGAPASPSNALVIPTHGAPWKRWLSEDCPRGIEGGRHGRATELAGALLNKFQPPETLAMMHIWNRDKCKPPLEEREIEKLVSDFAKTRAGFPDDPAPRKPHKGYSARELLNTDFTPLNVLVDPFFKEGDNMIICGETGVGKSFVAGALAFALTLGHDFYGFPVVTPASVVLVDIENGERRLQARVARLAAHHNATPDNLRIYSFRRGLNLGTIEGMVELTEITKGFKVVILDPFLPFFPGIKSENDNSEVRKALDNLAVWAEAHGHSLVVVDHAPALSSLARKEGEKAKPRGATAKKDWAAVCMALMGGDPTTLHWTKTRDCKPPEPIDLAFDGAMLKLLPTGY